MIKILVEETYLGDGIYASYDGDQYLLRAPRSNGDHFVALEPEVLQSFLNFISKKSGVTILVTKKQPNPPCEFDCECHF